MLAALLLNQPSSNTGIGADDHYYRLARLMRERRRRKARAKARTETPQIEAQKAYATILAVKPETARQIVWPFGLQAPQRAPRFVIDWDRVIADQAARESLLQQQAAILDDEEVILLAIYG